MIPFISPLNCQSQFYSTTPDLSSTMHLRNLLHKTRSTWFHVYQSNHQKLSAVKDMLSLKYLAKVNPSLENQWPTSVTWKGGRVPIKTLTMNPFRTSAFSSIEQLEIASCWRDNTGYCGKIPLCTLRIIIYHSVLFFQLLVQCGIWAWKSPTPTSPTAHSASHPPLLLHTLFLLHHKVRQRLVSPRKHSVCLCWATSRFAERRDMYPGCFRKENPNLTSLLPGVRQETVHSENETNLTMLSINA